MRAMVILSLVVAVSHAAKIPEQLEVIEASRISKASCIGEPRYDLLIIRLNPSPTSLGVGQIPFSYQFYINNRTEGAVVNGNPYWFKVPASSSSNGYGYVPAYETFIYSNNGEPWCSDH